jgi:hypothetical protein
VLDAVPPFLCVLWHDLHALVYVDVEGWVAVVLEGQHAACPCEVGVSCCLQSVLQEGTQMIGWHDDCVQGWGSTVACLQVHYNL